jgi:hypothetical protein
MKRAALILLLVAGLSGCAAPAPMAAQHAATEFLRLFGGPDFVMIWDNQTISAPAAAISSALIGTVGLSSPYVADIHRVVSHAKSAPVRLGVSGKDSAFVANAVIAALDATPTSLPQLQLAYIGSASDAAKLRAVVERKGGRFLSSPSRER